jgi:hypothetical protein
MHGEERNAYRDLVEKSCGKRLLERLRRRWDGGVILTGFIWLRVGTTGGLL